MAAANPVRRMKDLITLIRDADIDYFVNDTPRISDLQYDDLVRELKSLEQETGILFSDSPTRRVGGDIKTGLKPVAHTKPMLSAQKTKNIDEILNFAAGKAVVVSWKLDGLTLVLRYQDGKFLQAITRGRDGTEGEDVTHTVKFFRNLPRKVACKEVFEVRGEGVCAWEDFAVIRRGDGPSHPRNLAAGAVRTLQPEEGRLVHLDFIAFELIRPDDPLKTKTEQLDFLAENGFAVVEHRRSDGTPDALQAAVKGFQPQDCAYPVDGVMVEYEDLAYGRSLGATEHHENRMIALKWEDTLVETVFRGVELVTTRTGAVEIDGIFDPVEIDGALVQRANLHGLAGFEKLKLGIGDTIRVYKANRIVPEVADNLTQSGTFVLSRYCPCCGTELEIRISPRGARGLYCPNEDCLARNAQKIARFCDKKAMNIEGLSAAVIQALMEQGFLKSICDLYHLSAQRDALLSAHSLGVGSWDQIFERIENSRRCTLARFLTALGIPLLGAEGARRIDERFEGSFRGFSKALSEQYDLSRIEGIGSAQNSSVHSWFKSEKEREVWIPLLDELKFAGDEAAVPKPLASGANPLQGQNIAIKGVGDAATLKKLREVLGELGAGVQTSVTAETDFLLVALKG